MKKSILVLLILSFITSVAFAHGGRTNSEGCHNDTKKGTYHCH